MGVLEHICPLTVQSPTSLIQGAGIEKDALSEDNTLWEHDKASISTDDLMGAPAKPSNRPGACSCADDNDNNVYPGVGGNLKGGRDRIDLNSREEAITNNRGRIFHGMLASLSGKPYSLFGDQKAAISPSPPHVTPFLEMF
ncbi:hypothetical protein HPP92_025372 [Vanilla planifolia]|uniref:Uncharacterized protein n=1 Tax=Vanilla planifolia TaxID=51239 RepID=A0A835U8Y3_VANPL|nr:hypothetical protein HPP92_025372 [Vanilla planifolia]